ncbi:Capsule polysaccharide biosynthesis protein [Tranquillimonas rosea]|uniref:Capsule polysaccharide biosynthesis protein n=1 Tax=Tranquillimonas rosea TaxID=641238 RepID=A0A1H9QCR1_9RHOB|nr:hypothetical protein [Tranquillimonas rosea]SER58192.1 Capsule polysaccharide biosynthesis protein [Tranquillimonas rosea]
MTLRLCVVSTNKFTNAILDEIESASGGEVEVALHNGRKDDDFRASALSSMRARKGRKGHLFQGQRWTGAAVSLFQQPDFIEQMEEFIDHLHRRSDIGMHGHKAHPLRTMQDYADFYHILADVIAQAMIDRGVTHCVFFNIPHLAYDTIFFQVAKALGIPVTMVTQSLFPDRYFSLTDAKSLGAFPADPSVAPIRVEPAFPPDPFYMKGVKQGYEEGGTLNGKAIRHLIAFLLLKRPLQAFNPRYVARLVRHMRQVYGGLPKWRDPFARFFHEDEFAYFDQLVAFENQEVDLSGDYVYVPLQLQPEMTTSALGGRFRDQALAIERLADLVTEGTRILVKENPKQRLYMRGPMFFHRLNRIPNVEFLPSWVDTKALISGAKCVATITGTAGWEAIRVGVPALVFGAAWYRGLHGVTEYRDDLTWDEVVGPTIDHAQLEASFGQLMARSHEGVVNDHYIQIVPDYDDDANRRRVAEEMIGLIKREIPFSFDPAAS